ncbi:hypothetical protein [uncultured Sunxiuqinia sp.]|uniref:hypothetical protein n=1 Tax=uncultured Sunxiuqinia sp. TaxID=1573825 RepID=UPI00261C26F7|nr:hypothetical protein [uncultured Sunxiuqinia sp.]
MRKVEDLQVTVTYRVGLGDVSMPEKVYKQLFDAAKNGDEIDGSSMTYSDAAEWLSDNIRERDCMDWECEIDELS